VLKHQKRKEHLHGHPPKLENVKMEVEEEDMRLPMLNDLKSRGQINSATIIYKNATTRCRITKMPVLGLKYWPIHLDDVEMTWK